MGRHQPPETGGEALKERLASPFLKHKYGCSLTLALSLRFGRLYILWGHDKHLIPPRLPRPSLPPDPPTSSLCHPIHHYTAAHTVPICLTSTLHFTPL